MRKYLAVHEDGEFFIEASPKAMEHALIHGLGVSFYRIDIDPDTNKPSLEGPVDLEYIQRGRH